MGCEKNGSAERDWKLFRKKLPDWQENCMERLNKEYIAILSQENKDPSEMFWELDERIQRDKKLTGVMAYEVSRSNMFTLLLDLLREKTITLDDLSEFSEELQERLKWLVKPARRKN